MRKIFLPGLLVLLVSLAVLIASYFFYFPGLAHERALETFSAYGLNTSHFPEPQKKPGALLYKDIQLDVDGITTIHMVKVDFTPLGLLWDGRLKNIDVYTLDMTGEQTSGFAADVSGIKTFNPGAIINFLPTKTLHLKTSRLSLLTQDYGGLSFDFDWQGRRKDKTVEFQAHFKSNQRYLSFIASANGVAGPDFWNSDLEIEQGKFEIPRFHLKVTRTNGWMNVSKPPDAPLKITSELRAGGVNFLNLPWQNGSATIEIENGGYKIYSEAKSVGHEGTEFLLNIEKNPGEQTLITGTLHTVDVPALTALLKNGGQDAFADILKDAQSQKEVTLNFGVYYPADKENFSIKYVLRDANMQALKEGRLDLKAEALYGAENPAP